MPNDHSELSIVVAGTSKNVVGSDFVRVMDDALEMLGQLDRNISGVAQGSIIWEVVDTHKNYPITLKLHGRPKKAGDFTPQVIDACMDGLEALATGRALPPSFNQPAEASLFKLVSHYKTGLRLLELSTNGRKVAVTDEMLTNINLPTRTSVPAKPVTQHREYGEVEGQIQTVSSHEVYYFNLREIMSGKRVRCTFDRALRETVRNAWTKRAVVRGIVAFANDGFPVSIEVEDIILKPELGECPLFKTDAIDITGGVESSAYIRGARDDD